MARKSKYQNSDEQQEKRYKKKWIFAKYIRLSKEDEEIKDESNSVISQNKILDEYISRNQNLDEEYVVYDTYVDDGYSGTDFDRPDFQRLLEDMKAGKFNTIIIKDLSRLGRNYIEAGNYIEQIFPLFKIRFVSISEDIDSYRKPTSVNNVLVPFKNLMNDEYCRDISNKILLANNARKRSGQYLGSFPLYGYIKDPKDKYKLIVDDYPASVIRLIFQKFIEGKGKSVIAKELNDMGVLSPTGYKQTVLKNKYVNASNYTGQYIWSGSTISNILKNEMYLSHLIQGKKRMVSYKIHKQIDVPKEEWIVVKNTHEPIIDEETFNKAQDIMSRDTRIKNDGTGKVSKFAGYIKCADCKRAMQKKNTNNKYQTYYYYVCSTYRKISNAKCTKHTIRTDKLEKAVLKAIQIQIDLVIEKEQILNEINKTSHRNLINSGLEQRADVKKKEKEKYIALKKSLYEDWKMGYITQEEYLEYKSSYDNDILKCDENLMILEQERKKYSEQISGDNEWIQKFKAKQNITELTREVITEFIDCIYVHEGGNVTVKFKFQDEYERILEYIKENETKNLKVVNM